MEGDLFRPRAQMGLSLAAYIEMLSHLQAGKRTALGQKAVLDAGQAYPPFAYSPQGRAFEKQLKERK